MNSTLTTAAAGSNCPSGGTDPRCTATVTVLIPGLTIVKTANVSTTTPGSGVGVHDHGHRLRPDVVHGRDGHRRPVPDPSTTPTTTMTRWRPPERSAMPPRHLTWTGSLSPGGSATITYSVTVDNPDTGDKLPVNTVTSSAAGSSCPPGTTSAACQVSLPVLTPALTIVKTASTPDRGPGPGRHLHGDGDQLRADPLHRGDGHRRPVRRGRRRRLQRRRRGHNRRRVYAARC